VEILTISPGIYRHFKGKLYFFTGEVSWDEDDRPCMEYYPLYVTAFRKKNITAQKFFRPVEVPGHEGARFVCLDVCPDFRRILPCTQIWNKDLSCATSWSVVVEVFLEGNEIRVSVRHADHSEETIPLEMFLNMYIPLA